MKREKFEELLLQALEAEIGGVQVYEHAIRCAVSEELKKEWEEYLEQTREHERLLREVMEQLGCDADKETPGRQVVRHIGESLVEAIRMAAQAGDPEAAQTVACECVVYAETKDHLDWELLGETVEKLTGEEKQALTEVLEQVEEEEDEHLYHSQGWCRELWLQGLGLPAVIPPPEEEKDVKTAIGAARAKQSRRQMLGSKRKKKTQESS